MWDFTRPLRPHCGQAKAPREVSHKASLPLLLWHHNSGECAWAQQPAFVALECVCDTCMHGFLHLQVQKKTGFAPGLYVGDELDARALQVSYSCLTVTCLIKGPNAAPVHRPRLFLNGLLLLVPHRIRMPKWLTCRKLLMFWASCWGNPSQLSTLRWDCSQLIQAFKILKQDAGLLPTIMLMS